MMCNVDEFQASSGASSRVCRAESGDPLLNQSWLSLPLASESPGELWRCSARTSIEASVLPSFSSISDSKITVYSPKALALRRDFIASFMEPASAATNLALSVHALPKF